MDVNSNPSLENPENPTQIYYNRHCYASILEATEKMTSNEFNFSKVLDFLALRRRELAFHLQTSIRRKGMVDTDYGERRDSHIFLCGDKTIEMYKEKERTLVTPLIPHYESYAKRVPPEGMKIIGRFRHNGKEVNLTEVTSPSHRHSPQHFIHTKKAPINDILNEVNMLVLELESIDHSNIELFCEKIGEIHWWLANAAPWTRGSAAICDMFSKVLFKKYGYQLPRLKKGVMADCEALIEADITAYSQRYISFFKEIPTLATEENLKSTEDNKKQLLQEISSFSQNQNTKEMISAFLLANQ
jgi:hypothetical protein